MSSAIWTRCVGDSERRPLRLTAWRVVEAQHEVGTRLERSLWYGAETLPTALVEVAYYRLLTA